MTGVPERVRADVERAWAAHAGVPVRIASASRVGGGCISPALRVESEAGDVAFLKWGTGDVPSAMFRAEATSLQAMRTSGTVRVPQVLAVGDVGPGWILLEWLPPGSAGPGTWEELGRALARMHMVRAERFGWREDNFIGSLPQENAWAAEWPDFWRARRLEPQLRRAYAGGHFAGGHRRRFELLLDRLPELLAPAAEDGASLVHGDLWGGNVHVTADGAPALIDPAAYHGHREVDLAMSELFGGFGRGFYRAYDEVWPLADGYAPVRRAIYQLYYLLVHVNLFGGGYASQTLSALSEAGF